MIQLLVKGQEDTRQTQLDLANPGELSLSFEATDFKSLSSRKASFSKTFTLPNSDTNGKFFGHYFDVTAGKMPGGSGTNVFDARFKAEAEIRVDGAPILQGYLQLKSYNSKSDTFTAIVFGDEANLFQDLGSRKVNDILINDNGTLDQVLDHQLDPVTVVNSFDDTNDITAGSAGAGTVIYPIADYGTVGENGFLYGETATGSVAGVFATDFLNSYNFRPAIKVDYLFRRILSRAGYSLASNSFLSSDAWTKLYMTMGGGANPITNGIGGMVVCSDQTDIATLVYNASSTIIAFNQENGPGINNNPLFTYDLANNYNTTTHTYTVPGDGVYVGQVVMTFDTSLAGGGTPQTEGYCFVFILGSNGLPQMSFNVPNSSDPLTITFPFEAECEAGQELQVVLQYNLQILAGVLKLKGEGSYWAITGASTQTGLVRMQQNLPKISQASFVKDLVQRFNMCIIADRDNPRLLNIEPYQTYFDSDTSVTDWTQKLDVDQAEVLEPTVGLMTRTINFKDADDSAYFNALTQQNTGSTLGAFFDERTEAFVQGELKNDPVFAPYNVAPIPSSDVDANALAGVNDPELLIGREFSLDGTPPTENKPKLMYYNGLRTINSGYQIKVDAVASATYPNFLPYLGTNGFLLSTSPVLQWDNGTPLNIPLSLQYGGTNSNNGYYSAYWAEFLRTIYDQEARLYTANFYLEAGDIYNFAFSNRIQVRNQQFRVIKIQDYQPFSGGTCKVTMLKLLEPRAGITTPPVLTPGGQPFEDLCALTVVGTSVSGEVQFEDGSGASASATEACCVLNGYHWTGSLCIDPSRLGATPQTILGGGIGSSMPTNLTSGLSSRTNRLAYSRFQHLAGQIATSAINPIGFTNGQNKSFVYQCTSVGTTLTEANLSGDVAEDGTLYVPLNCSASIIVEATSVQINQYGSKAGDVGSTSFRKFAFIAKNFNSVITVTSTGEVADFRTEEAASAGRRVELQVTTGAGGKSSNSFLKLVCGGEDVNSTVSWVLKVDYTLLDFGVANAVLSDVLVTESTEPLMTENGSLLEHQFPAP